MRVVCEGFIGPGACLVATGYVECSKPLAVAMIVVAVGLSGISMAGWAVNHLDLAPPYAGITLPTPEAHARLLTIRYYKLLPVEDFSVRQF